MAINNQPTIKPRTVTGLFTKFIPKVIPLAFDESMSYYECLCALLDYINKNVIPALDNNAEGLLELQEFYEELQTYVNDYFKNLDVQEEINNKLDDMVEQGTLQEIIASYLNSVAIFCYDTVSDMKLATNLINGSFTKTLGFYSMNDGGESYYKIRTKNIGETPNEINLISLYDSNLIAELIIRDNMSAKSFGCKEENEFDNYDRLNIAIALCDSLSINENYYISEGLTIDTDIVISGNGKIYIDNGEKITPITVTGNHNITIKDIEIDGTQEFINPENYTSQNYLTARSNNMFGIYVLNTTNIKIENVYIHNITQGIVVRNSNDIIINNCTIKDTLADGIYISDNSHYVYVTNNVLNNTGDDSLACVSTRVTYNLSDLEAIEGFTRSLTFAQLQALIISTGTIIIPIKQYNASCSEIYFENNVINITWNSGIKVHGGNNIYHTNNTINNAYSWGLNMFYADRCQVSGDLAYYTFNVDNIKTINNTFDKLLSSHYKASDIGTFNIEGITNVILSNNTFTMSSSSDYSNPLSRIATSNNITINLNRIIRSKLLVEYTDNIEIIENNIMNSYAYGISCSNSSNITIHNNSVLGFNTNAGDWQYGIAITSTTTKNNLSISGNTVETTNNFQGKYQFQNMQNVYIDFMDMSKHGSVDISLLGRVNNSVDVKCNTITSTIAPPANITQFIAGTKWINTTNNSVYLYNGSTWSQLTLS